LRQPDWRGYLRHSYVWGYICSLLLAFQNNSGCFCIDTKGVGHAPGCPTRSPCCDPAVVRHGNQKDCHLS
jgi:hypothetical protein